MFNLKSFGRQSLRVWRLLKKPDSQVLEFATHHPYKNTKERYDASVTVWDHEDNSKTIHFPVIMAEL